MDHGGPVPAFLVPETVGEIVRGPFFQVPGQCSAGRSEIACAQCPAGGFCVFFSLPGKHRKVPFFEATVAGFRGRVDGNEQQLVFVGRRFATRQGISPT